MITLFLDIDGVLCTYPQYNLTPQSKSWVHGSYFDGDGVYPFDKKCVKVFNKLLDAVECEIIISSDWRVDNTLEQLQELFKINGVDQSPVGVTDLHPTSMSWIEKNRAGEILKYVKEHDITKYIAIDDLDLHGWLGKEHFALTDDREGIKKSNKLQEILKKIEAMS